MANYNQTQLDTLRNALASGHLKVKYNDMTVEYRSLAEMKNLIATMETDIASSSLNAKPPVRQIRVPTSKGVF